MKKLILATLLLIGFGVVVSSCSKSHSDKEEEEEAITLFGNWQSIYVQDMNDYGTYVTGNPYPTGEFKCKITDDEISGTLEGEGSFKCSFKDGKISQNNDADVYIKNLSLTSGGQLIVTVGLNGYDTDEWYRYTCQKIK